MNTYDIDMLKSQRCYSVLKLTKHNSYVSFIKTVEPQFEKSFIVYIWILFAIVENL